MFCKYMGSLFTKARGRDERRFQTTKRDVARILLLFRRTIAALKRAKETGEEGVTAVEREVGLGKLDQALPVIDAVAGVADVEILATAAEKYAVVRRFSLAIPGCLSLPIQHPRTTLCSPLSICSKATDESGARVLPKRLPSAFLAPKWRRMIFAGPVPDRRLYETAVLAILRDRLRVCGRVGRWQPRPSRLRGLSCSPRSRPGRRRAALLARMTPCAMSRSVRAYCTTVCSSWLPAPRAANWNGVEIEDGSLYIARTKPTVPDAARLMAGRLYGMLPRVRVTEVVADVADNDRVRRLLHPPADRQPARRFAGPVCRGAGRRHQSRPVAHGRTRPRGMSYHHLVNVAQWHVNEDNYASGRAAHRRGTPPPPTLCLPFGATAPTPPLMASISVPAAGPDPAATSTPNTGSTPASCSTRPSPVSYGPMHTRVISATAGEGAPTCWMACIRRRTGPASALPSTTPIQPAPPTTCSVYATFSAIALRRASRISRTANSTPSTSPIPTQC